MTLLRKGSRGTEVARVQDAINRWGELTQPELVVDGIFGDNTRAAVIEFQHKSGLAADGIVGPNTTSALRPHFRPGGPQFTPPRPGSPPVGQRPPNPSNPPIAASGDVVARVTSAAVSAFSAWRSSVTFFLSISGSTAFGGPGCASGLNVSGMILGSVSTAGFSAEDHQLAQASAEAIGGCLANFQGSIRVPGLPWYPAFAAWPGPLAPPMPNIPSPLASISNLGAISPGSIRAAISQRLGVGATPTAVGKGAAIGNAVGAHYMGVVLSASVRNVMGKGPVPTFSPPTVPVGPVVGGSTIPTGGHI
jgi:hypothetical protein